MYSSTGAFTRGDDSRRQVSFALRVSITDPEAPTLPPQSSDALEHVTEMGDAATLLPSAEASTAGRPTVLSRGATLGRYLVLDILGRGGMGVVYAAYDPELDRKVAIKLLRPGLGVAGSSRGRSRLVREAQALAKLSHRNVVTVHDVGELGDSVFVAMEFVEGRTLSKWLDAEADRDWREILAVFLEAGRGLEAAHRADLVHRDFKPDNVMVADDGRVVVLDFGLAHGTDERADENASTDRSEAHASSSALLERLTLTGAMMGTPAYMSPEQFAGRPTDARTDQFSYCVALYRALYGRAPFSGETVAELTRSVLQDEPAATPRGSGVPGWVRRAIVRGMARKVDDRYPTMNELLAALGRDPGDRWRRGAAVGVIGLVAVGIWGAQYFAAPEDPCDASAAFEEAWGPARRVQVQRQFAAIGKPLADDTAVRVADELDDYARKWVATREQVCRASHSKDTKVATVAVQQLSCLDSQRGRVASVTSLLAGDVDEGLLTRAVDMVSTIDAAERCLEPELYLSVLPQPDDPELRDRVAALRRRLVEIDTAMGAGRYKGLPEQIEDVLALARELEYPPTITEAVHRQARVAEGTGDIDGAIELFTNAARRSLEESRDFLASESLRRLAALYLTYRPEPSLVKLQLDLSRALATRIESPSLLAAIDLTESQLLRIREDPGALAQARAMGERALESFEALGNETQTVASLVALSNTHFTADDYEAARKVLERAKLLATAQYGERHPEIAIIHHQLARVSSHDGDHARSVALLMEAHDIFEALYGRDHVTTMAAANGLSMELGEVGRLQDSLRYAQEAFEVGGELFTPPNEQLDRVRNNYATALRVLGRAEEAVPLMRDGLRDALARDEPEGETAGRARDLLADTLRVAGEAAEAVDLYEASIAYRRQADPPRLSYLPRSLAGLALARLALGQRDDARAAAQQAVDISREIDDDGEASRVTLYALAYVLEGIGDTAARAALDDEVDAAFARSTSDDALAASYRRFRAGEDVPPNY